MVLLGLVIPVGLVWVLAARYVVESSVQRRKSIFVVGLLVKHPPVWRDAAPHQPAKPSQSGGWDSTVKIARQARLPSKAQDSRESDGHHYER